MEAIYRYNFHGYSNRKECLTILDRLLKAGDVLVMYKNICDMFPDLSITYEQSVL